MSDRRRGIGCDQFLTLRAPTAAGAAVRMDIHNPDGSVAEACGNGTRCVAALLMEQSGDQALTIETLAGQLDCRRAGDGQIAVDMGPVQLAAADIPLAEDVDSAHVTLADAPYSDACCVGVGNPHAVFFVADAEAVDLAGVGPRLETHPMFPARANIEFVAVDRLRPSAHAGVGTGRRHHPGLRVGRLRQRGGGGAARSDRARGDGRSRRWPPAHHLARRRPCDHGRANRAKLHRGDRRSGRLSADGGLAIGALCGHVFVP